ncbi:beta galactosidase jelly roll domain-containing protein [uncultured Sunxiuqinia sp.]|uniref:beta galactosidase jelly roll domain-containing protein n=1 Tax=uncultured Sunxiuqinia sp. TaxID=1573825 RepID=UPI002AA84FF9|nr:beta galactosidase jelly roll domain-containing protein [uncultured Sunxiuqinia sp.]
MRSSYTIKGVVSILSVLLIATSSFAFNSDEKDLSGQWKFRIGDRYEWATTGYDDSDWDDIRVPARWEDEGFRGYDGYAWYRTTVRVGGELKDKVMVLELGYIDDVDEVFVNGVKVGQTGSFPPNLSTAYNALRKYQIPSDVLQIGEENLIAVRVYDSHLEGGIVSGNVRLFSAGVIPPFQINMTGSWLFNKGKKFNPADHRKIQVPGVWENQGYKNLDGHAVYAKKIKIAGDLVSQRLVLLAGKIDDADMLFINGELIARTGDFSGWGRNEFYNEFRNYFIAPETFKAGVENLIEIRVFDSGHDGGIYEGPVGIMTQDDFRKYWKSKRRN